MSPYETAVAESVFAELGWESRVADARIRVLVVDDVVVLLGQVSSYEQKCAAARAALRADGVVFVHNRLEVMLEPEARVTDVELQHAALRALGRQPQVPDGAITVEVRDGRVTLSGLVALPMEVDAALAAVRRLVGLRDLRNELRLSGRPAEPVF